MANNLFPVFLKIDKLKGLIVGGGEVAHEKLFFMLKNSPDVNITLVANNIEPKIIELVDSYKANVKIKQKAYDKEDLEGIDFIIAATNNYSTNKILVADARKRSILINVADTPDLCYFYLGGVVTRGDLKIAISTNGKSPTFAKRIRQLLEDILPAETNDLINNLQQIRDRLTGNFTDKVKKLNELTADLLR